MNVPVMLEKTGENGYRATALLPTEPVAEAPSRDEALNKLQCLLEEKLAGAELVELNVRAQGSNDSWARFAGIWKDDPSIDEVVKNIEEYRRELDADPERA